MVSRKKMPTALIALAYVFGILFSTLPVPAVTPLVEAVAPTCDVTLNPGDSIQTAINNAAAGDVICLNPGTYPQASAITVDEEVTIIRTGCDPDVIATRTAGDTGSEAIIDGGGSIGTIFDIDADNVTLACLEVKSSTGDMIYADPSVSNTGTVIKNNIIHDSGDEGVQLRKSPGAILQYNEVYDTVGDGLNLANGSDGGQILDNKVYNSASTNGSIYVYDTENVTIDGNLVYGATADDAIHLGSSGDESLSGGSITNNVIAGGVQDAISVRMSDVTVSGNKMTGSPSTNGAIYVYPSVDNVNVNNNLIKNNTTTGVKIGASATNILVNNNCIEGNTAGVNNLAVSVVDATNNWWGAVSGPSGSGPGTGDSVSANVTFSPFNSTSCGLADIIDNDPTDGIPDGADDPLDVPTPPGGTCNGLAATIYVDGGVIVGGPNNGLAYSPGTTTLLGTAGDDVINGTIYVDKIDGAGGNDTICGLGNADNITAGSGNDWIHGGDGNNTINAGDGNNEVYGGANNDNITTGTGDDTIDGGNGSNTINDAGGTNSITTGTGVDNITTVGSGVQTINSDGNADTINTGDGDDIIDGGDGNNIIDAGNGNNQVTGGANNDNITTGTGNDTILGGNGSNTIHDEGGANTVTTGTGVDNITMSGSGIQNITSGGNTDYITTEDGNDIIDAGDGNNVIYAGEGNNQVTGGANNDTINTGSGDDTINAGNGSNTIVDAGGTNTVTTGTGVDNITMNGDGDNNITAGGNADTITTTGGDDVINAGDGNNIINAGDGNNVVTAGANNDTITTGSGHDHIQAGNGSNNVDAGAGNDSLVSGTGVDTLDGGDGVDYCDAGTNSNTLLNCEFDQTDGDGVVVIVKDALPDHAQDFGFTGDLGAFTLDDDADGTYPNYEAQALTVASYDVTESAVANWDLTDLSCYDVDGGSSVNLGSKTVTAELDADEVITCVFENTLTTVYDFGDAADPMYPTLLASNGARHILGGGVYLGSSVDDEADGLPSAGADGDDTDGSDDEDGVTFGMWMAGEMGTGTVVASTAGYLDAWADFNNDGDWDDMYEHIVDDEALSAGSNSIIFPVPTSSYVGNVVTRFRFASTTISTYTGEEADGEVEDYLVAVAAPIIPVCNGQSATIYVDGNGKIVGGPLNGTMYAGTLTGTSGDDVIVGTSGADTITGEEGDDRICGGDGDDVIRGNQGEDKIWGEGGEDELHGNAQDDVVRGGPDADTIYGGGGEDKLRGNGGDDYIEGGNGADDIEGGNGADEIYGEAGEDTILGENGDDYIEGGDDNDYIEGGAGEDEIYGQQGLDEIYGGTENDEIFGGAGADEIYGDDGDDYIDGGPQPDTIYGGAGEDEIYGDLGPDVIYGGADNDYIESGAGEDEVYGEGGNDEIYGGPQDDMVKGGDGEDEIYGGFDNDFLCGDNDNDYIEGNDGDDTICGSTGDDEIYGGAGADEIDAGEDSDTVDGGADSDICVNGEFVSACEDTTTSVLLCDDKAPCLPEDLSLVGYWRFDESSGNPTAKDSSDNGNDGTYNGPTQSTDVTTLSYGNMFSRDFDGIDDHINAGDDASLNFERTDTFSASAWIKRDTTGKIDVILSKRQAADYRGYVFYVTAGDVLELNLQNSNTDRIRVEGSTAISAGTWYHVAFSYDGSSTAAGVKLFVDGVEESASIVEDTLTDTIQSTGDFEIGDQTVLPFPFAGLIDDVRVYNRALTESESAELYSGLCEDSGAVTAPLALTSGGANGFFYKQKQLIKKLNNFGNSNFVNSPTPPAGFGGPEYFGGGTELLDWDQLSGVCTVHDEYYQSLYTYDVIELMAENFAHMFGVSEEFILDIIVNGTYCEPFYSARAEDERVMNELIAQEEQRKHDELMALYYMYKPEVMEFAVGEDGYPVSSDMIWNACIRNFEVFIAGESKPLNCRRYHDGNMWEHPDTFVSFSWSPRLGMDIGVRGYQVATFTVPTPEFNHVQIASVGGNQVAQRTLSLTDYIAQKGVQIVKRIISNDDESVAVIFDADTSVLSEESTTISQ